MVLEQIDEKRLLIALSSEDMDILDLTFTQLSWKNDYSRQVIKKILLRAETEIGFSVKNNQMMIEAIPQNNGCIVLVTLLAKKKSERKIFKVKEKTKPYLLKFSSLENLFCAIERIFNINIKLPQIKSSVFEYKKIYYMLIYYKYSLPYNLQIILTEYCDKMTQKDIAIGQLIETGNIIVKNNAIETIGEKLIKPHR